MYNGEADQHAQKSSLQMKQDDKFFCRLLSKESSFSNPSFRVTPVAIPFLWESQPGTPKHTFSHPSLPPLTPPPSYFYTTKPIKNNNKKKASRSTSLFHFLFPKLNLKRTLLLPSSSWTSSSSSSSSSISSFSSDSSRVHNVVPNRRRRRFLSYDSSVDLWGSYGEDDDDVVADSRNLTLCFGLRRTASSTVGFGSCCRRQA